MMHEHLKHKYEVDGEGICVCCQKRQYAISDEKAYRK